MLVAILDHFFDFFESLSGFISVIETTSTASVLFKDIESISEYSYTDADPINALLFFPNQILFKYSANDGMIADDSGIVAKKIKIAEFAPRNVSSVTIERDTPYRTENTKIRLINKIQFVL